MRCSKCGVDNRETARFCDGCGAQSESRCPSCGQPARTGARFCGSCGTALQDRASVTTVESAFPVTPGAGERRHLTVLFCDLASSTEIAARLDPEDWHELMASYHRAAAEAITRFGGYVGQYLGDGVMAYFGWPEAHDNDGERAARAGLAILESVLKLRHDATSAKLVARVGIDSGTVVIDAGMDKNTAIFGETPNIAARLQATAVPGTVLITAATHRLISGLFVVEALGPRALKGITTPPEVFQVIRPTRVRGRLGAAHGLTPFVGREEELWLLLSRWERTREGEGHLALIMGEPGIGKSRLVAEFHDCLRDTPHIWMESAGEQIFENTPFHAIIEMLSRWLELQDATDTVQQYERLERALTSAGLKVAEIVPLIADLLQLPAGERYPASTLTGEQKRRRLLAALSGWVLGAAGVQPLVMVVEDLHWLDPSTLELLQLLAEQGATVPLMLLYTARPEYRALWPMRTHHSHITLNRLSSCNVREMVTLVAAPKVLDSESVEAVVARAVGVPLFVEELTHAVLEGGIARGTGRNIPATLHDLLMARLDRLGSAKEIMQIGAVIGSEFSHALLHAVHPIPDEELQDAILSATDAELVYVRGIPPDATYQFKHALICDAAYEGLLRSRRRELHSRIAEILVRQFPERVISAPELVAYHYTEAGLAAQAIPYWQRAAQRAIERSANLEAFSHLARGLKLLPSLPEARERLRAELALRNIESMVAFAQYGGSSVERERLIRRICELGERIGEVDQLLRGLITLCGLYFSRGEPVRGLEFASRCFELAEATQDEALLTGAYQTAGVLAYSCGNLREAVAHLETAAIHAGRTDRIVAMNGMLYSSCIAFFRGPPLQLLGRISEALKFTEEGLRDARESRHLFTLGLALLVRARVSRYRREPQVVLALSEEGIALSEQSGFPIWLLQGRFNRGWALVEEGHLKEGIIDMEWAVASIRRIGGAPWFQYTIALLAQAYAKAGETAKGRIMLNEALTNVEHTGEKTDYAEMLRLKGELLLMDDPTAIEEAEVCFRTALEVARAQEAKWWELRTAVTYADLLCNTNRRNEAHTMLAEIYSSFTEGFDTVDLKEAKALLDELNGQSPDGVVGNRRNHVR
jgi:class 3 adenylate cyclase/tetratricopeptide (TPR) repeat protein